MEEITESEEKFGLVLEGGAMRGIYTAGVLDVFMQNQITFDGVMGVSAGAAFGVNLLSGQQGRVLRYNKKYNSDKKYMGLLPLMKTGNIIDTDYAYHRVPYEEDPFDDEAFKDSEIPFYAVVTDIETGIARYVWIRSVLEDMDWIRASASMPFVSKPVKIGSHKYLDGGVADPIPSLKFAEMGYQKQIVVLTKPKNYVRKPVDPFLVRSKYQLRYPLFAEKLLHQHETYAKKMNALRQAEADGRVLVLQPSRSLPMNRLEKDPKRIQALYELGVIDTEKQLKKIKSFINPETEEI